MKKIHILILTLSTGFIGSIYGQSDMDYRERFTGGLKAGINYANVWDSDDQEFDADGTVGFAGGAFLSIPIGKFLGVQPEVLYSQKGFQADGVLLGNTYSMKRTMNYLDIPLQLQIKPAEFLTILAGPQFAFQLSEKTTYMYGANGVEQKMLGFIAGLDINISHVVISGRFGFDFQKNNGDGSSITPRYRNQWAQLALGYRF